MSDSILFAILSVWILMLLTVGVFSIGYILNWFGKCMDKRKKAKKRKHLKVIK